ncbi:MAG: hypothetical protein PVF73_00565 [Bacteroidales bacterium]|jgi:hypothetical protein
MNRIYALFAIALFFFSGRTFAQDEEVEQILLSPDDVKTFVHSFPAIKQDFEKLNIKYDSDNHDFTLPEVAEILDEVNDVVTKYGYTDYTDFILKTATISVTYVSIRLNEENVNAQPEFNEAIKEIEENPHYSAEQKEQMISMLKQSSQTLNAMSEDMADPRNIAVVMPFADELEVVLEED